LVFTEQNILLSHSVVGLENAKLSVEDFLRLERNYPAIIFIAHSRDRDETIKIFFVNKNTKSVFADNTFPNAESEPPQLYIQSPDPARLFSLMGFFKTYLERPALGPHVLFLFLNLASLIFVIYQAFYFLKLSGVAFTEENLRWSIFRLVCVLVALLCMFKFFALPTGLWIKPKRELRVFYLVNMALKGELKDNPLVSLVVSVLGGVVTVLILKLVGLG